MATRIRASCGECGDIELSVPDVHVRICATDDTGTYVFRCPLCDATVVRDAEPRVVDLLLASGVELVRWHLPDELSEPRRGPAFTHDDLLDFHHLLQRDDWMDQLLGSSSDGTSGSARGLG